MARNEIFIDVPPATVFAVLSEPESYGGWVPGTRTIRTVEGDWPAAGSAFHHTIGLPVLAISDRTCVLGVEPPERLELQARAGPLMSARVTFVLVAEGAGTRLTMVEEPSSRLVSVLIGPVGHALILLRNIEALRRLKALAERRGRTSAGERVLTQG